MMKKSLSGGFMVRRIFAMLVVYGMMALGLLAQTFSSLFSFNGTDGSMPDGNLVQGIDGNLYGATQDGGTYGYGTVFSISPSGAFTELYSFCTNPPLCTDGEFPFGGLVQAADGNFYGTAAKGGNSYNGTIFRITPSGMLTTVYLFCSQSGCTDGSLPYAGLVLAPNGDF